MPNWVRKFLKCGLPDIRCMYGVEHESLENIMADVLEEIKTVESDYGFTMDA